MLIEADIDLHLVAPGQPGTVRAPHLVVVTAEALVRVDRDGGLLRAVELPSTSTKRTDIVVKHSECADAGIDHYWMVDLLGGPSRTACHHGGPFGYVDAPAVRGTFTTDEPFPVRPDLDQLA